MSNFKVYPQGAYPFLLLDEKLFLKKCSIEVYMASGPGGQKRNRTYSAVRLRHRETGLTAIAEESRSQADNKIKALRRLRKAIALYIRKEPSCPVFELHECIQKLFYENSSPRINQKNPLYPIFCATVLDAVFMAEGKIGAASQLLHTSTGKLNKILSKDKDLFSAANHLRKHFNIGPLTA